MVLTDERAQLVGQPSGTGRQHLPPYVLKDHRPGLQVHHEHGRQLRLGPGQLCLGTSTKSHASLPGGSRTVAYSHPSREEDKFNSLRLQPDPRCRAQALRLALPEELRTSSIHPAVLSASLTLRLCREPL